MPKRVLILAPHVDDEFIGCSQVILNQNNHVTVAWFYDITLERRIEGIDAAAKLGFIPMFTPTSSDLDWSQWDQVLVPRRDDAHPAHKAINTRFREHATDFYSIDMLSAPVLPEAQQQRKRELLNMLYPSQSALWERDHKYWLFENVSSRDYETYASVKEKSVQVTCLVEHVDAVKKVMLEQQTGLAYLSAKAVNKVIAACPTGKVVIESVELGFKVVI